MISGLDLRGVGGYVEKWPYRYTSLCLAASKVSASLLFAVVVELAFPVHHVRGPAVELYLPLTLCFINVVWEKKTRGGGEDRSKLQQSTPFQLLMQQ